MVAAALGVSCRALGDQRPLSRRALRRAVRDAALALRDTDRVPDHLAQPRAWRTLSALNPMTGVVEGFRWAVLGKPSAPVDADRRLGRIGDGAARWRARLLRPRRAQVRGHHLIDERRAAIEISGLGKRYTIGVRRRGYDTLRESDRRERATASLQRVTAPHADACRRDAVGAARRLAHDRPGRGGRPDRPQRRRQDDAAQDPLAHHRAERAAGRTSPAESARCSRSARASIRSSPAARTSFSTARSSA